MKIISEIKEINLGHIHTHGLVCGVTGKASRLSYLRLDADMYANGNVDRATVSSTPHNKTFIMLPEESNDRVGLIYTTNIEPAKYGETSYLNLGELIRDNYVTVVASGRIVDPSINLKLRGADQYILMIHKSCILYYKRNGVDEDIVREIIFDVESETVETRISNHTILK